MSSEKNQSPACGFFAALTAMVDCFLQAEARRRRILTLQTGTVYKSARFQDKFLEKHPLGLFDSRQPN